MEFELILRFLSWYSTSCITFCTIQIIISIKLQKFIRPLTALFLILGLFYINLNQKDANFADFDQEELSVIDESEDSDVEHHYFGFGGADDETSSSFLGHSSVYFNWLHFSGNFSLPLFTHTSSLAIQKRYLLFRAFKIPC